MVALTGWDRLVEQVIEHVYDEVECSRQDACGNTEIERLFDHSLNMARTFCQTAHSTLHLLNEQTKHLYIDGTLSLFYERNVQIGGLSASFVIHCYEHGRNGNKKGWKKLAIECNHVVICKNSHDEIVSASEKIAWSDLNGCAILRLSGADIMQNPLGCARQVYEWAEECWP